MPGPGLGVRIVTYISVLLLVWSVAAYLRLTGEATARIQEGITSLSHKFPLPSDPFSVHGEIYADSETPGSNIKADLFTNGRMASSLNDNLAAVIIEDRNLTNLVPLVLHFASVLGPSWPVSLYTTHELMADLTSRSKALERWTHQISVRELPVHTKVDDRDAGSNFLTDPWLWEDLAPAEHVMIFHADSMICANSPHSAEDFLKYDFIGAPIAASSGGGYSEGLSIHDREKTLELVRNNAWSQEANVTTSKYDEQWFYKKWKKDAAVRMPKAEVAKKFAVGSVWYDRPFGYHSASRLQADRMKEIEEWCPEIRLTSGFQPKNASLQEDITRLSGNQTGYASRSHIRRRH